jgi:DNA mismatch repair protein MutS
VTFQSIFFQNIIDRLPDERVSMPGFFVDLNLDQIVAAITAGREEYNLKPFFHAPLHDVDAVTFRHEIMQDLEGARLFEDIKAFAQNMRAMREHLAQAEKLRHPRQKERSFLDAAQIYCGAISRLIHDLSVTTFTSRGLLAFKEYVTRYAASAQFTSLLRQTKELATDFSVIAYSVLIQMPRVDVRLHEGEPDYSAEVLATFERFKQGAVQRYKFDFSESPDVNHIEGQILDRAAQLYRDAFLKLNEYYTENKKFEDSTIVIFDREIQFYIAYLEYIAPYKRAGLNFCYPRMTEVRNEIFDRQGFDLALAGKLVGQHTTPVCNDFHMKNPERIIVVSGPNQGGKTTFARTFGQLHYLASLGCPVPGTHAQLYLFDKMFAHFDRGENIVNLRGKLQDDLVRIHQILADATPRSIIVMNELFASTALRDAIVLSEKIAAAIMRLDLYCVWVTFIDELASLGEKTVSMVSTVVPENPALRTYKIVRRPADGLAYAMSIAEKYQLTYDMIKERIGS